MAQLSYSINLAAVGYPGQPFDTGIKDATTAMAVAAAIPYGVLVVRDSGNSTATSIAGKLPASSNDVTVAGSALGVAMADQARAQDPTFSVPTYPQNAAVPCARFGRIWVVVEEAVNAGDQAYVRYAAGSGTQLGAFRKSADTSTAAALPNAYYVTSQATPAGYAVVELQLN